MKIENNKRVAHVKEKKSKRSGWIIFLIMSIILAVGVYFAWSYFQKPVYGEIKISQNADLASEEVVFERFEGEYFSFHHDERYVVKSHNREFPPESTIVESAFLSQEQISAKKIAVTVEKLINRGMQDSGNYIMREKSKNLYIKENITSENEGIVIFAKKEDGFVEKDYFIPKKDYLLEIAFTGPIEDDVSFEAEIRDIIKSIQFKR